MSITSTIEFQMSLLLFFALAGYLLASRINQSAVIGQILVGLLIGPSVLGLITYTDFVRSIAHLGAIILLFVVGLEFKLKGIYNLKYGLIAFAGVVVPWIGGYLTAIFFGYDFISALFVGTALTATSIAITAQVLKEMGKLQAKAAKVIIGAAIIDDVLGLLVLSMSVQLISGTFSILSVALLTAKALGFLFVGTFLGYKALSRIMLRLDETKMAVKYPEIAFIFAMMVAFFYSMAAELIGLSTIVGAFIAGVSLEGVGLKHGRDYKEGAEYLYIIFGSIFFVSLGILVNFTALNFDVIVFLVALTAVAIVTKVAGCTLPAMLAGMSRTESLVIGFGMSPRGEVAMVVALIGLSKGLIGQELYAVLVLMSLLTTIATPIVLRNWLLK